MPVSETKRPIEDLQAGDAFRQSLVPRADSDNMGAPLWYGWALMDAFLAGLDHARANAAALSDQVVVPREPTDEMICAGDERIIEALQHHELIAATPTPAEKCYRAMIAVCTPPQPSEDNGPDTNGGKPNE